MKIAGKPINGVSALNLIGWGLSLFFIFAGLCFFDWGKIWDILKQANPSFLLILFFIYIFDFFLRAYRWKLLLKPVKRVTSFPRLFYSYNIGYLANLFLPARAGEFVRVFITSKDEGISKRTIGGTIILERIFDIIGMGILVFSGIYFFDNNGLSRQLCMGLKAPGIIFLASVGIMAIFVICARRFSYLSDKFTKVRKSIEFLHPIWQGFQSLNQGYLLFIILLLSVFMWALNTFIVYLYMRALSFSSSYFAGGIVLTCQLIGEFIPSAPSSVGTFHASTIIGSKFAGLSASQGLALGFLNHTYDLIVRGIIGTFSMRMIGFSFRKEIKNINYGKE